MVEVLARELIRAGRSLARQGMMAGTAGNLSARLGPDRFLITASGVAKGRLLRADLLEIDPEGRPVVPTAARPSAETAMHLAIYKRFPWVGAVVHAHPVHACALAVSHRPIPVETLPEALFALGSVPMVPYLPPGEALAQAAAEALDQGDGLLLLNHGAVTVGRTVAEACGRMEVLESLARVALLAPAPVPLAPGEVARIRAIWQGRRPR